MVTKQFDCPSCAAQLQYDPSQGAPTCPYCGFVATMETTVEDKQKAVEELDLYEYLEKADAGEASSETQESLVVKCEACYAESTLIEGQVTAECPFCGTQIVTQSQSKRMLRPRAVLPFSITDKKGHDLWQDWIKGLWFAPNKLKETVKYADKLQGIYIPYWTFDAKTDTKYTGERGDISYVKINGKKVPKIKWSNASGEVWLEFDDVIVIASHGVPHKYAERLVPWKLEELVPYDDHYLSGFKAEAYQVDLRAGFAKGQEFMEATIDKMVRKDIGGDQQRIHNKHTEYSDVTFKHILLPIWISAYRFNDKVYQFLVNGQTGRVQGERPWSWVKISLLVLTIAAIAAAAVLIGRYSRYR